LFRRWGPVAKCAEDLGLGTVLVVLMLPLMVAIVVAIRLDTPGPALFPLAAHPALGSGAI
jgi:lipopolysaccharide/colanic/teichoic acid biosynthesis glycosyltransferase